VTLIVTGASGRLGRLTVAALLDLVPARDLVLVSRSPRALADLAGRGITVRPGDFDDPASLPAAFAGGDRVLVISAIRTRDDAAAHAAAFRAAGRAGAGHIVFTSLADPVPGSPMPFAAPMAASEQALRECGTAWTILRNALYADIRVQLAPAYIRDGRWTTNMGDGAHAFVSRADCAAAAVAVVAGGGHAGRCYDITGPELIDAAGYLEFLRGLSGRPVVLAPASDAEYECYRSAFMADPANGGGFELLTGTGAALRAGYMRQLTPAVRELTGRAPASLAELAARARR
jgi:NAD(P)H dehydrogenase (quinone)